MKKLGEKSNWQKLSKRSATETLRNRDVYETQQLDRGQIKHKQSFLSRHLIAIALGILGFMLVWSLWSFSDVSKLDEIAETERTKIIVKPYEPAAEGVRDFSDAMWANMILVPDKSYSGLGYTYRDSRTDGKYTQAEYDYWSDIQRRIRNGEMPNLLSRTRQDGTIEYKERDPLLRAPDYPRHFSDAQYLNFREAGIIASSRYSDLGYDWYVSKYNQYLTQAEYDIAMSYTDEQIASLIETGQLECREQTNDDGEVISREYRNVVKYAELVIPTEDAGDRYLTPIALDNMTWANMVLKENSSAASLHYTYADTRTGYFYTTVEYEHWKKIKSQAIHGQGDCKFWMEISPDDGEYVFSSYPAEIASNLPRDSFLDYPVTKMMQMVMRENQFWSKYGYGYFDTFTGMFYSQAEYDLWMDVQKNVENGTYIIPDDVQATIRERGQGSVTDIVWNALTPLPVTHTYGDGFAYFDLLKFIISLAVGFIVYALFRAILKKNLDAQNLMNDTSDINQYENDQHIALPEEIQIKFDWFPDVGAHCPIQVSSMISHMMLTNKGLKSITLATRADKDIKDSDGEIEYYKGEILLDDKGEPITKSVPMIDTDFATALYEASGAPKEVRKFYDPTKIPYNPDGADRTKQLGVHKTVADAINAAWTFPLYEPQRPAGAYMVDTEPVNTMVLAITRAGKGQTVIEPTIDMWTRESNPNNMVINDPKGELLVKNYVRGSVRGFQIVQFNLINAMKTDIYNPLGMAADAAREGDFVKCAMYVDNIASVFFPLDGGDDPVWPNAANNAFKRAAYGLMDYYLEEEKALRLKAERINLDPKVLETMVDQMWGKVTLYNCYQFFVQLTSKKLKNPLDEWGEQVQQAQEWVQKYQETITEYTNKVENIRANIEDIDEQNAAIAALGPQPQYQPHANPEIEKILRLGDEEFQEKDAEMNRKAELWDGKPEADLLSLYFAATDLLPRNSMRNLVSNANNALKSMAGAEKMLASVYGIAITAMSFFTDPTISTLTSGTPSQNVDLAGMSFPRRLGVRLHPDFLKIYHLVGLQAKWTAYEDDKFEKALGKDFNHEDLVTREGWCRYYFKGLFPNEVTFLKLQIKNARTDMLVKEFFFKFEKSYQTSLDGRFYVKDPVLGTRIVKNGVMTELKPVRRKRTGEIVFVPRKTTFKTEKVDFRNGNVKKTTNVRAIIRTMCRYSEKPKMVFLVTPPHLMNYAKLILILIKQLVDLNFDQSYMTKDNQKPLYKTRFMLDELGNLQSEGHGISGFETMLSIGLGQEQQFTLILQTLQQLKDVYGDSVDKIVQGNAQPLNALIGTPDGWKKMGDVHVGDEILTPYGNVTTVTGVYPKGVRPVYRVTLRDGSTVEVCNQHLWQIERYKTTLRYSGVDKNGKRIYVRPENGRTCELVTEIIDTDELKRRVDKGRQVNLPKIKPVAYNTQNLPIHPYVLGAILGDANIDEKGHATITINSDDYEIIDRIHSYGYELTRSNNKSNDKTPVYYIKGVAETLRDLGLAGHRAWEKFIPEIYLYSDISQRILLLQGIMDTDGTISKSGEMEFTSSSKEFAENVQSLIRSLGGRVGLNIKHNVAYTSPKQKTKKEARAAYRVQNIKLFDINPFLLSRKADRWVKRTDNAGNRVVSVEFVRYDEVQCIRVADDRHLYITDDYIPTHNTSNIVFLKSTDDAMIETLQKMSGTTHKSYTDSKSITRDMAKLMMQNEGKTTYTMSTKEVPVITYNDMAFISERNSIIFRAGDAPIWNRNETILPMSWRLFKNTITQPGKSYSLQTIPTLSTALDFDIRQNQPDFMKMLDKRMAQAVQAPVSMAAYREAYGYNDTDMARLDIDSYSDEVMEIIEMALEEKAARVNAGNGVNIANPDDDDKPYTPPDDIFDDDDDVESAETGMAYKVPETATYGGFDMDHLEDNTEVTSEVAHRQAVRNDFNRKIYAGGYLGKGDFIMPDGSVKSHALDKDIIEVFTDHVGAIVGDTEYFAPREDGGLNSKNGVPYIVRVQVEREMQELNDAAQEQGNRVFSDNSDGEEATAFASWRVTDEFYKFLASLDAWTFANGVFEDAMKTRMEGDNV